MTLLGSVSARAQSPEMAPAEDPPLVAPPVQAASAILMDAITGTVLWERNSRVRRPNASTTKIMTATLMIESARLDEMVTFSDRARKTDYANLNARPGEQFSMYDLLYAVMLRSSNDACVAVGEHLQGSAWKFAWEMTQKAHEIGAVDTNFVTTNGLYHPNHYSTAYDLALMARYAFRYPLFNQVAASKSKMISRSINQKDRLIKSHNKFLVRYAGADGVKTGYVSQSGKCLVASSTRMEAGQPWRLVAVVLNTPDTYGDSARLMDWGRKNFQPVFFARQGEQVTVASVKGGIEREVPLIAASDLVTIIPRVPGKNTEREIRIRAVRAPIDRDQVAGTLVGLVDGQPVGQVNLVPARPVTMVWTASVAPWTGWSMLMVVLFWGPRYARAFAKSTRRRRRRLAQRRRNAHQCWQSLG